MRLLPIEDKGKVVWREDAPAACPDGHRTLAAAWGPCPDCPTMLRIWRCRTDGCALVLVDDEHVHRGERAQPPRE